MQQVENGAWVEKDKRSECAGRDYLRLKIGEFNVVVAAGGADFAT